MLHRSPVTKSPIDSSPDLSVAAELCAGAVHLSVHCGSRSFNCGSAGTWCVDCACGPSGSKATPRPPFRRTDVVYARCCIALLSLPMDDPKFNVTNYRNKG